MTNHPAWGRGPGVSAYALANAEVILRLLLPARAVDDTPISWRVLAGGMRDRGALDGATSWMELTEISGSGTESTGTVYSHPAGWWPEAVLRPLIQELQDFVGVDVEWHYAENDDRGGSWSELAPAGAWFDGQASSGSGTRPPGRADGGLSVLASVWARQGFHGRAWDSGHTVGIAADSYADSLILSGPRRLAAGLADSGLEVFSLGRAAGNPMTSE